MSYTNVSIFKSYLKLLGVTFINKSGLLIITIYLSPD